MTGVITSSARGLVGVDEELVFLGEALVRFGVDLVSSKPAEEGSEPRSEGLGDAVADRLTTIMSDEEGLEWWKVNRYKRADC